MKDIKTTKHLNIRGIVTSVAAVALIAGIVGGLTLTTIGRAITFAVTDPATVNKAAAMKADYVREFELTSSPKE